MTVRRRDLYWIFPICAQQAFLLSLRSCPELRFRRLSAPFGRLHPLSCTHPQPFLEEPMITLSESASKELTAFFASHDDAKKSIRIFFAPGG